MPELVTLPEDGPLGKKGDQVWVDDSSQAKAKAPAKQERQSKSDKS